jgi:hypothetical protein
VVGWEDRERMRLEREKEEMEGVPLEPDSEDDEIVFVGRNGGMRDVRSPRTSLDFEEEEEMRKELLLFHSPVDDTGASFGWV